LTRTLKKPKTKTYQKNSDKIWFWYRYQRKQIRRRRREETHLMKRLRFGRRHAVRGPATIAGVFENTVKWWQLKMEKKFLNYFAHIGMGRVNDEEKQVTGHG